MKLRPRLAALVLSVALASCGGGGGSSAIPAPNAPGQPSASGAAKVRLTIPSQPSGSSSLRRNFVSSGANGAVVAAGSHGGTLTPTTFDISSGSTVCATGSSGRTCTLNVVAPIGSDDFQVTLYDTAPSGGSIPTGAHVLGVSNITNIAVVSGQTPTLPVYVLPTIGNVGLTSHNFVTLPASGVLQTSAILLDPTDFSNAPITAGQNDPYSNPIVVTVTETAGTGTTGHTQLTVNGTNAGTSATLTQSSQSLGIAYDGLGSAGYSASISITAGSTAAQTIVLAPLYVTSASPYFVNGALSFTGLGQTATLNISEASGTNTYVATQSTATACTTGATVGSVTGSGASATVVVTSQAVVAASNGCTISVNDGTATTDAIAYITTTTGPVLQIGGITEYGTPVAVPNVITAGADGNIYVASSLGSTIWGYDTSGNEVNWTVSPPSYAPVSMAPGPDGNIWFVTNGTNSYTYATQPDPTPPVGTFAVPGAMKLTGVALGPNGDMWMIDNMNNAMYDQPPFLSIAGTYALGCSPTLIANGGIAHGEYVVCPGTPSKVVLQRLGVNPMTVTIPGSGVGPSAVAVDSGGNLWIADQTNNALLEYAPTPCIISGGWCTYPIGATDSPAGLAFGSDGNLYFTAPGSNSIGEFNVTTHVFTHFSIPSASANPAGITAGPDGRIWFTEGGVEKMGALTP